jgi:hypothetical protein
MKRWCASPLYFADYREHVSGLLVGKGFDRGECQLTGFGEFGASQGNAMGFGSSQSGLGPGGNHRPFLEVEDEGVNRPEFRDDREHVGHVSCAAYFTGE